MTNHIHLALEVASEEPVSKAMHRLASRYSIYFNRRHARVGHLFQGRYKAILVERDEYLLEVTRYVHLNPVRAGMVKKPEEYPWSSYRIYVNETPHHLVDAEKILSYFGKRRSLSRDRYKKFVEDSLEGETAIDIEARVREQAFLGSSDFIREIKSRLT